MATLDVLAGLLGLLAASTPATPGPGATAKGPSASAPAAAAPATRSAAAPFAKPPGKGHSAPPGGARRAGGTANATGAGNVQRWDLRRFEAEGLKRSLAIRAAGADVSLALARRMEAAWARFPRFEWTSLASPIPSLRGDPVRTTTPTNQFVGFDGVFQQHKLDIFLPLFTFGKLRNAKRAAEWAVRAAQHGVDRMRAEVKRDVRKAFWAVKVAGALLKIIHEGSQRLEAAQKKLMEFLDKGAKEVEELDRNRLGTFSAEVASRREEAVRFEHLSHYALRVATGLDQEAPIEAERSRLQMVRVSVPPLAQLIEMAMLLRPEVKALGAAIEARRAAVSLRKSFYYPDLFIAGTVGVARCNVCTDQNSPFAFDPFNMDLYGAALGIRLTFDYPQKIAKVRAAEAELAKLVAQRDRAAAGLRLQVRDAWLGWKQARAQKRIITKGRKAAQGWLFQSTINFNTGLSKLKDLTDALAAWFKFRLKELEAIFRYNVSVAELSYVVGRDLPLVER